MEKSVGKGSAPGIGKLNLDWREVSNPFLREFL
jgi:hypothetical protein